MKFPRSAMLAIPLCGIFGYYTGLPAAGPSPRPQSLQVTSPDGPLSRPAPHWKQQLTEVRQAPASRSEPAWIKWAFAVPDADLAAAIASLNPRSDFHALRLLFSRWVQLDAGAAWKAFDALPIPDHHFSWYDRRDPNEIGMSAATFHDTPRMLIQGRMLHSWHRHAPEEALAYARKIRSGIPSNASIGVHNIDGFLAEKSRIAAETPASSLATMAETFALPASDEKLKTLRRNLHQWAAQDADAAARFLLALPEAERLSLKTRLDMDYIFRKSPPELRSVLLSGECRGAGITPEDISQSLTIPKGSEGMFPGAYETTSQLRQSGKALVQWALTDAPAAQAWLKEQPDDALKSFFSGEIAGGLSHTSPREAITLLDGVPDAELPIAVAGLTGGWMQKDAAACAAWANKIEDPATRDMCHRIMAQSIAASDPGGALRFSMEIADPASRQSLQKTLTAGLRWNPAALEKILGADPALAASLQKDDIGK